MNQKNKNIGIMVGHIIDEIGPEKLWSSFFENIISAFPEQNPVKKFPLIMKRLPKKGIKMRDAQEAIKEMLIITERLDKTTSHGRIISASLLTSTGRNITRIILESLQAASDEGENLRIVSYGTIYEIATKN